MIGCGLIGVRHVDAIIESERAYCAGVLATGNKNSKQFCEERGLEYVTDQNRFFRKEFDGIIIASPNESHLRHLALCAYYDISVLIEKPVIASNQSITILDNINQDYLKNRVLAGHHRHHHPYVSELKRLIEDGALGRIVAINGKAVFYKPESYFRAGEWRTQYGIGGVGLINLVHEVGLMRYLIGEVTDIKSFSSNLIRGHSAEETIALSISFENGALGTFIVSDTAASPYSWEMSVGENSAYPNYDYDCYEVMGTNGSIGFPSLKLANYSGERNWWSELNFHDVRKAPQDPFLRQFEHFCDVVEGSSLPLVSFQDGLACVRYIEDILKENKI